MQKTKRFKGKYILVIKKKKPVKCFICNKIVRKKNIVGVFICSYCKKDIRKETEAWKTSRQNYNRNWYKEHHQSKQKDYSQDKLIFEFRTNALLPFYKIAKKLKLSNKQVRYSFNRYLYHITK